MRIHSSTLEAADVVRYRHAVVVQRWRILALHATRNPLNKFKPTKTEWVAPKNGLKVKNSVWSRLWNGVPIGVQPPNFVELKITETDPGLRGDTSGGGGKPATLETGAVVRVRYL